MLPAASPDGLELHRDFSIFRDQSVAWQCEQVCRSNASILWDRRSRRASIAGGAESVGRVARQGKRLVKELDPRVEAPSADTVAVTTASLRSDRNFVRLVRVAKRQSEGAAVQKSLCVRQRRAIQIGRATRGVRHNVPQPLQTETRTGSVDKPLAEFASVQGRKTERSRPSQRRVEVVRVTGRPSASRGDQGAWQSAFFPVAAFRSAPSGNGLCNGSASGVSASSHLPTSAGAVMIAGIALGAQGWHWRRS